MTVKLMPLPKSLVIQGNYARVQVEPVRSRSSCFHRERHMVLTDPIKALCAPTPFPCHPSSLCRRFLFPSTLFSTILPSMASTQNFVPTTKRCLYFLFLLLSISTPLLGREAREQQRIDYLLDVVGSLDNAKSIRNGSEYDAKAAEAHLRQKLDYAGENSTPPNNSSSIARPGLPCRDRPTRSGCPMAKPWKPVLSCAPSSRSSIWPSQRVHVCCR